jgi:poly-beta-1,6-N-acetyl-D-glucosamine synthase
MGSWYGLTLFTSFPDIFNSYNEALYGNLYEILNKGNYLPITVIIPAFNEKKRIFDTVFSLLQSNYQNIKIIIVNDGSTDDTLKLMINEFDLYESPPIIKQTIKTCPIKQVYKSNKYKNMTVIDKEHSPAGNGADANNCGINATITPVYLTVDADTILEAEALTRLLLRFISKKHTITIGGVIYVLNGNKVEHGRLLTTSLPRKFIPGFQAIEYIRSFTYGRSGLNMFSGALCNPGAFTLNETNAVKEVHGYDTENYAYDAELTMKLHYLTGLKKYPTKIYFLSNTIAWTIVPSTLKSYWLQRNKWQRGMLRSALKYKSVFLNPRYGYTGMIVFPAYLTFDIMGPVIEFISYILLILTLTMNLFSLQIILWFLLFAWGYIVLMTIASFYLNLTTFNIFKKYAMLRAVGLVTLEMFGFRQFRAAACFFGTFHYFFNRLLGKPL